jgi:hypothetical protein
MTGPVSTTLDTPLDADSYKHQLLLLKSVHCARPVLYQGRNQFINGLSLYQNGGRVAMTVYLAGITGPIASTEVQIAPTIHP